MTYWPRPHEWTIYGSSSCWSCFSHFSVREVQLQLQSRIWIPVVFCSAFRTGMAKERKLFGKPMTVWVVHRHFVCLSFEKIQAGLLQNLLFFLDGKWLGQPCYDRHDPRLCLDIWQKVNKKKGRNYLIDFFRCHLYWSIDRQEKKEEIGRSELG